MLILDNVQNLMHSHSVYLWQFKIRVCKDAKDGRSVIINLHENTPFERFTAQKREFSVKDFFSKF